MVLNFAKVTSKEQKINIKSSWKLISATVVVVSAIWGFFYYKMVELKNQQIDMLRQQSPEAVQSLEKSVKALEKKITPLVLAIPMDELDGRVNLGTGLSTPSKITMILIDAQKLIEDKKFDLADVKVAEIENLYPDYPGTLFMKYQIQKAKNNQNEAMAIGEELLGRIPSDKRLLPVYIDVINALLARGQKSKAEKLAIEAMRLGPDDKKMRESFKEVFGYEPSIQNTKPAN